MTREEFNNQSLPKSDVNSNLETLSRNMLRTMFNPQDFEIRDEYQLDKGIDLFIEIKKNGNNTNLRFPVQLKATQSLKKNSDGSISFPIAITNINYLLNDGLPAFYILYHHSEKVFYFERVRDVERILLEKYTNGAYPESFTFRFNKLLNDTIIENIHAEMLSMGYLRRNLNKTLQLTPENSGLEDTIVIQKDQQVYSATEKVRFLEKYGYRLLNEGRFQLISDIEKTCYPLETVTADFHFICGTAAHYTGQLYKALEHFKQANKDIEKLHPETQNMMHYYTVQSKRSLGMIDAEKSSGYIEALMDSEYLGLYLKLQKAFEVYYISDDHSPAKLRQFQQVIDSVLADPHCDESLKLIADSYLLSVEGHRLNGQLLDYLLMVRASVENPLTNPAGYKPRAEQVENYNRHFNELKAKAFADKNQFTYHNICLNGIKVQYIKTFYTDIILGMDRETLTIKSMLDESDKKLLRDQADYVGRIAAICEQISASHNMMAALSQQYELLHFLQDFEAAEQVLNRMEQFITENDWHGLEESINHLKNGGTSHESFAAMVMDSVSSVNKRHNEAMQMSDEINQMDLEDKQRPFSITGETCQLQIIPFGFFCFDKSVLDAFFDIIKVTEEGKKTILNVMKMRVIAVVNIYNDPIVSEGYANGEFDYKGMVSLKHIHRIRKELREIGAYRVYPKFGS